MTTLHSNIGASSCSRWWNCPGSVALSANFENKPSKYAAEGTVAHSLCEALITGKLTKAQLLEKVGCVIDEAGFEILVDEEMVNGCILYFDTIVADLQEMKKTEKASPIVWKAEQRIVVSSADEHAFGTLDFGLYRKGDTLFIDDFKYGKGVPVEVFENKQLMYYAAGFMDTICGWVFDRVVLKIIQPRAPHRDGAVRIWETTPKRIAEFRDELKVKIMATRDPMAPTEPGEWCRFCPALADCGAIAKRAQKTAAADFTIVPNSGLKPEAQAVAHLPSPDILSIEAVGEALRWEPIINSWFEAIRMRAKATLESGQSVPGWKLVKSKTNRQWTNEAEVIAKYEPVLGDAIYAPKKLMSPAALEKKVGKEVIATMTFKPEGNITVAPESDPRPATITSAQKDFAAVTFDDALSKFL